MPPRKTDLLENSAEPGDKFVPNIKTGDTREEDDRVCVVTWVKLIHYEWLLAYCLGNLRDIAVLVDQMIREARAKDPYKGGKAVGAKTVPAEDFKQ